MIHPTTAQLRALRAVCETGSRKAAAKAIGRSLHTVTTHMQLLRAMTHTESDAQLCYRLVDALRALNGDQDDELKL